jgi:hypothetical protein
MKPCISYLYIAWLCKHLKCTHIQITTDPSSRQRGRYKIKNLLLSKENFKGKEKLVTGPGGSLTPRRTGRLTVGPKILWFGQKCTCVFGAGYAMTGIESTRVISKWRPQVPLLENIIELTAEVGTYALWVSCSARRSFTSPDIRNCVP